MKHLIEICNYITTRTGTNRYGQQHSWLSASIQPHWWEQKHQDETESSPPGRSSPHSSSLRQDVLRKGWKALVKRVGRRQLVKSFWCSSLSNRDALDSQQRETQGAAESAWPKGGLIRAAALGSAIRGQAESSGALCKFHFKKQLTSSAPWILRGSAPDEVFVHPDPERKKAPEKVGLGVSIGRQLRLHPSWLQPQQESLEKTP